MSFKEKRPYPVYLLFTLVLFQGLSGLLGGFGLISDPTGGTLQIPLNWLDQSPFHNYLIPGVILFVVLGVFPCMFVLSSVFRVHSEPRTQHPAPSTLHHILLNKLYKFYPLNHVVTLFMKHFRTLSILIFLIVVFSLLTTLVGIFSKEGSGIYEYVSIRGQTIEIYGRGLYKHMSADVAIQGIAQDYVTLVVGLPLLIISFFWSGRNSIRGRFLLAGTLMYSFVTYLFYLCMGMYNYLFLAYIILTSCSFFGLTISVMSLCGKDLEIYFKPTLPFRLTGGFLMFSTAAIGLMWLSVIVPPLIRGEVYPEELNHYTTLIVQGLDLSILLPLGFVAGWLFIRKNQLGYLMTPIYMIFLGILMTALTAKVIGMSASGVDAGPAILIIPLFNLFAVIFSIIILKNISEEGNKFSCL